MKQDVALSLGWVYRCNEKVLHTDGKAVIYRGNSGIVEIAMVARDGPSYASGYRPAPVRHSTCWIGFEKCFTILGGWEKTYWSCADTRGNRGAFAPNNIPMARRRNNESARYTSRKINTAGICPVQRPARKA